MSTSEPDRGDTQTTRVTDMGQTTIPKSLREKYGIEPGDAVRWEDTDEGIVVRKVVRDAGRGMLVVEGLDREEREAVGEELAGDLRELRETEWAVE